MRIGHHRTSHGVSPTMMMKNRQTERTPRILYVLPIWVMIYIVLCYKQEKLLGVESISEYITYAAPLHATDDTVEQAKKVTNTAKVKEAAAEHETIMMAGTAEVKTQERTKTTGENHNSLPNVTIMQRYGRVDRLGSNLRRPFFLMAYADCRGYNFCIRDEKGQKDPQLYADAFPFPICSRNVVENAKAGELGVVPVNASGVYSFVDKDGWLRSEVMSSKLAKCTFTKPFRETMRNMIMDSTNRGEFKGSTITNEELFTNKEVTTIAVHVRRGDITKERNDMFLTDELFVVTIEKLREMMSKAGRSSEVHLFSEDYGTVNWTAYDGLVDHFHLAPQMNPANKGDKMDMHLNLRDWKHFVKADILVAGGSFSRLPGFSRADPDMATGLPLTITFCVKGKKGNYDYQDCDMFPFKYSKVAYIRNWGTPVVDIEFKGLPVILKNLMVDTNTTDDHTLPSAESTNFL